MLSIGGGLLGGDKTRAHVRKVCAHDFHRAQVAPIGERAREDQRAIPEAAHFIDQRERRQVAAVPASPGTHQDQAIDTAGNGLARVQGADHIVENQPTIAMHPFDDAIWPADRSDDDGHPVAHHTIEVGLLTRVGAMQDQVDAKGCGAVLGMGGVVLGKFCRDLSQPLLQRRLRPCIERRERTHHPGLALRDDQLRGTGQEHRRADQRQAQSPP
ncbi:hypothetical protein D3C85_1296100 [compost metagenome]